MQSSKKTTCLIFSKDRATQLLLLLDSIQAMCFDMLEQEIIVLYKTSSDIHQGQYEEVAKIYTNVVFHKEVDLLGDIHSIVQSASYITFMVDDCICIKPFHFEQLTEVLDMNQDALGFSLRLGNNTTFCYPFNKTQEKPLFLTATREAVKFNWTVAEYDFGYPLELSSSMYRTRDILKLVEGFKTVNEFESHMASHAGIFKGSHPFLLCFRASKAFCNPMNTLLTI
jgi:hypothetical protein